MNHEETQSKQQEKVIREMAKARNRRVKPFEMELYLRAVRSFDPAIIRRACMQLCGIRKKGIPKPEEVKTRARQLLRYRQIKPVDHQVGPPSNYMREAGFIAMAFRLGIKYRTDRWRKARIKWDAADDAQREVWKKEAKEATKGAANV